MSIILSNFLIGISHLLMSNVRNTMLGMAPKKFYVVFNGREPGIYNLWPKCHLQVNGYKRALHCSYCSTLEDARINVEQFNEKIKNREASSKQKGGEK